MVDGHPVALRERVVAAYEAGRGTYPEIAELFGVGEASVKRWVWLKRKLGHLEPKAAGGGRRSTITLNDIEQGLAACADATALELAVVINRVRSKRLRVHVSSIKRALTRYGYVVKKSVDGHWRVNGRTSRSSARTSRPRSGLVAAMMPEIIRKGGTFDGMKITGLRQAGGARIGNAELLAFALVVVV